MAGPLCETLAHLMEVGPLVGKRKLPLPSTGLTALSFSEEWAALFMEGFPALTFAFQLALQATLPSPLPSAYPLAHLLMHLELAPGLLVTNLLTSMLRSILVFRHQRARPEWLQLQLSTRVLGGLLFCFFCLFLCLYLFEMVSLCSPGCPGTLFITQPPEYWD